MARSGLTRSFFFPVLVTFLTGCGGDNPTKPKLPTALPPPSTPENVLRRLEYAYSQRDSVETKNIYDSTYVGTSVDLTDPPGSQLLSFTYGDEISHVATLARSTTITSVECYFGSSTRLPSDDVSHPEWAVIALPGGSIHIEIDDGPDAIQVTGSNDLMTFHFKPTTPASSSPTDTLWKIVRWDEVHGSSGP